MARKIIKEVRGREATDGAGVNLVRVIGRGDVKDFDPFLMLDAFDSEDPNDYIKGFPMHPHRGIETITYLIKGEMVHKDSLGNEGTINSGECQWMTAGSGIMHEEMPQEAPHMLGLQIWLNLPKKDKMTEPRYFDINADMVSEVKEEGVTVKIISGEYKGTKGVQPAYIKASMFDIELEPNTEFEMDIDKSENVFLYAFYGGGEIEGNNAPKKTAILLGEGDKFKIKSGNEGIRFMLFSGPPIKEPVAWNGPIVMNTYEELEQAFSELRAGTFIK